MIANNKGVVSGSLSPPHTLLISATWIQKREHGPSEEVMPFILRLRISDPEQNQQDTISLSDSLWCVQVWLDYILVHKDISQKETEAVKGAQLRLWKSIPFAPVTAFKKVLATLKTPSEIHCKWIQAESGWSSFMDPDL